MSSHVEPCRTLWQVVVVTDHVARALFRVSPGAYVEERTRLAKAAKAAGQPHLAKVLQALKKPTLAMWAIVAAGDDADLVHALFDATAALGEAQASGDREATLRATADRRTAVEAVTAAAVDALRRHEPAAETRRPEIRTMVDQLSRHTDLASTWVDGTLRELPEGDAFGFAAFTGLEVRAPAVRERPAPRERTLRSVPDAPADTRPVRDLEAERAERAARAARAAERRDAIRARDRTASALAAAERRLAGADELFRQALADRDAAQAERDAAAARHDAAVARVDALAEE